LRSISLLRSSALSSLKPGEDSREKLRPVGDFMADTRGDNAERAVAPLRGTGDGVEVVIAPGLRAPGGGGREDIAAILYKKERRRKAKQATRWLTARPHAPSWEGEQRDARRDAAVRGHVAMAHDSMACIILVSYNIHCFMLELHIVVRVWPVTVTCLTAVG
jgi:hypothetical protein